MLPMDNKPDKSASDFHACHASLVPPSATHPQCFLNSTHPGVLTATGTIYCNCTTAVIGCFNIHETSSLNTMDQASNLDALILVPSSSTLTYHPSLRPHLCPISALKLATQYRNPSVNYFKHHDRVLMLPSVVVKHQLYRGGRSSPSLGLRKRVCPHSALFQLCSH